MDSLSLVLGILAALIHLLAYVIYNVQAKKKSSDPSAVSWCIWASMAVLNAFTYKDMSHSWVVSLQFFAGAIASSLTALILVSRQGLNGYSKQDLRILCLGALVVILWQVFSAATWANMLVLTAIIIGFRPTIDRVKAGKEKPQAWTVWTIAFSITLLNVVITYQSWEKYIMPCFCIVSHAAIAWFSRQSRVARIQ